MTNLVTVFDAHSIPSTASIEALSPLVITVLSTWELFIQKCHISRLSFQWSYFCLDYDVLEFIGIKIRNMSENVFGNIFMRKFSGRIHEHVRVCVLLACNWRTCNKQWWSYRSLFLDFDIHPFTIHWSLNFNGINSTLRSIQNPSGGGEGEPTPGLLNMVWMFSFIKFPSHHPQPKNNSVQIPIFMRISMILCSSLKTSCLTSQPV